MRDDVERWAEGFFRRNPELRKAAEKMIDDFVLEAGRRAAEGDFKFLGFRVSKNAEKKMKLFLEGLEKKHPKQVLENIEEHPRIGDEIAAEIMSEIGQIIRESFTRRQKKDIKKKLTIRLNKKAMLEHDEALTHATIASLKAFDDEDNPFIKGLYFNWMMEYVEKRGAK